MKLNLKPSSMADLVMVLVTELSTKEDKESVRTLSEKVVNAFPYFFKKGRQYLGFYHSNSRPDEMDNFLKRHPRVITFDKSCSEQLILKIAREMESKKVFPTFFSLGCCCAHHYPIRRVDDLQELRQVLKEEYALVA